MAIPKMGAARTFVQDPTNAFVRFSIEDKKDEEEGNAKEDAIDPQSGN